MSEIPKPVQDAIGKAGPFSAANLWRDMIQRSEARGPDSHMGRMRDIAAWRTERAAKIGRKP